ncbi:MAG: DEAD/DEAH box helicase, partial [Candidatus Limnocylindria bacterium]
MLTAPPTTADMAIAALLADPAIHPLIAAHRELPPRPPRHAPWPEGIDPRLVSALRGRGIEALYTHQAATFEAVSARRNVVVVTPTASGKTLCYNLPVLDAVAKDEAARALYLFPTKALAADQLVELRALADAAEIGLKTHTYDGDTPANIRSVVRAAGQVVITNPDMLHSAILPHHTKWFKLFENLQYVVIDELHTYRGLFGSHVANVIRRLRRICNHYGADPIFICASATIANPRELAERVLDAPVELIDDNGAPSGRKHVLIVNPPVANEQLGIRGSALLTGQRLAERLIGGGVQTIAFARSRTAVEVLTSYLRETFAPPPGHPHTIRGYRGGYLPNERHEIEAGLRAGRVRGVVATNALELGIDIGGLDAAISVGYPGTIASTWQQMGRSGRR